MTLPGETSAPGATLWRTIAALTAVTALLVGPLWEPGVGIAVGDQLIYFPTLFRAPWQGAWNDFVMCGTPALSNPQVGLFYPPSWLLAVDYFAWFRVFVWAHLLWGAIGVALWVRTRSPTIWAPLIAGVVWAGCGPTLSLLTKVDKLPGHAWLPWALLGVSILGGRPAAGVSLVAGSVAAMWFGGSVEGVAITGLATLGWAASNRSWRVVGLTLLGLCLGALLMSASLVPLLALLPETTRAGGLSYSSAVRLATHVADWSRVLLPMAVSGPWLACLYAGFGALILGLLAVRRELWAAAIVLMFVALALGDQNPLYPLVHRLPLVGTIQYPEKWWLGTVPFLAWMAGAGASRVGRFAPLLLLVVVAEGLGLAWTLFPRVKVEQAFASSPAIRAILADWDGAGPPRIWNDPVITKAAVPSVEGEPFDRTMHALVYPNVAARFGIADVYGSWALRGARIHEEVARRLPLDLLTRVASTSELGADYVIVWEFDQARALVDAGVARPVPAAPGDEIDVPVLALRRGPRAAPLSNGVYAGVGGQTLPVAWAPGWRVSVDGGPWADVPPMTFLRAAAPDGAPLVYRYQPAGLIPGAVGTLLGLVGLLVVRRRLG
jgi:hypothetical protein